MSDKNTIKGFFQPATTAGYFNVLKQLSRRLANESDEKWFVFVPFVFTCSSTLESLLNDTILKHSFENFRPEDYRRIADALLSITLRGKLDLIIPLISENKYILNSNSKTYKSLTALIKLRNKLTHNRAYFSEIELNLISADPEAYTVSIQKDQLGNSSITVSKEDCISFYQALTSVNNFITNPTQLEGNEEIQNNNY